jgi:tetratricopeptide (TPR) repeat protein
MTHIAAALLALTLFAQQSGTPGILERFRALDHSATGKEVAADPEGARSALDLLITEVDASVHSDRQRPEQRRVEYDRDSLALGVRLATALSAATGDRTYARRFRAREQRFNGTMLLNDRRYREALVPLNRALREAHALGDGWLETITHVNLAYGYLELGRGKQALAECEKALAVANGLNDRARALAVFNLASVHLHLGDFAKSIAHSEEAVALARTVGIRLWEGNSLLNLGVAHQALGDIDGAHDALEAALAVLEKTSDRLGVGRALYNLAAVAAAEQQHTEVTTYLERALPIIRSVDIRHSHAIETNSSQYSNPFELSALQMLVHAYTETGDKQRAATWRADLRKVEAAKRPGTHKHK